MPLLRTLDKRLILIAVAVLLVAIGLLYLAQDYRARGETRIIKRAIDLEATRAAIGKLAPHHPERKEMICRPDTPMAVRLVEVTCGGQGEILITYGSDGAGAAKGEFHASPGAEYIVDGVRKREIHTILDAHAAASIRRLVESAEMAIRPLENPGEEYVVPSFPAAVEACVSGRYVAVYRGGHAFELELENLWAGIHKELKAELVQDASPAICL